MRLIELLKNELEVYRAKRSLLDATIMSAERLLGLLATEIPEEQAPLPRAEVKSVETAADVDLDYLAMDFFGDGLPRHGGEPDSSYRARIQETLALSRRKSAASAAGAINEGAPCSECLTFDKHQPGCKSDPANTPAEIATREAQAALAARAEKALEQIAANELGNPTGRKRYFVNKDITFIENGLETTFKAGEELLDLGYKAKLNKAGALERRLGEAAKL
jgi:hypothetical protein